MTTMATITMMTITPLAMAMMGNNNDDDGYNNDEGDNEDVTGITKTITMTIINNYSSSPNGL